MKILIIAAMLLSIVASAAVSARKLSSKSEAENVSAPSQEATKKEEVAVIPQSEPVAPDEEKPAAAENKEVQTQDQNKVADESARSKTYQKPEVKQTPQSTNTAKLPASQSEPTASSKTVTSHAPSSQANEILYWINAERKANGLNEVANNAALSQAAYNKSKHMSDNNYFAHTSPDGVADIYFIKQSGYKYQAVGMNLAEGNFASNKALVDAWMSSPGHKKNILASFGKEIGIGVFGNYFTMFIANPL